jgi:type II secretory pathway pseudopilin PulG
MHSPSRSGFTTTELVIVLCVLLALAAVVIAVWPMLRQRTTVGATRALVGAVATALTAYSAKTWNWQDAGDTMRSGQLFDLNRDGLVDGTPAVVASDTADGGFAPEIIASGYRGFLAMTGTAMKPSAVAKNGQPLDAWNRPLRIAFAAKIYGTTSFGIWSAGPDGKDGTADDIQNWGSPPP